MENIENKPVDKYLCSCNKIICKRNMATHLKTKAHINAYNELTQSIPSLPPQDESGAPESAPAEVTTETASKKPDNVLKLKQEFVTMNEKLDLLLSMVNEIITEMYEDDDDLPELPETLK